MDTTTPIGGGDGGGTLVGRYALRRLIGQGGMADVMLAVDAILDREVAVKILHARYAADSSFLARFRREAQAAASLNHPNIVAVYDFGEENGRPFIVMEYVAGQSLRDLVGDGAVPPQRTVRIVGEAAMGLNYAHERGLVHRDIKPANILLSADGDVKVADFGIARAVSAESVTQTAAVFGTAAYVAPEQAQGENVDRRTDIYALGTVLYELLTARQPFTAESAVALAYKHVSEPPTPPTRINPDISPQLEAVVLKAMAKAPADRYQTARDMALDLTRAIEGRAVAAPPAAAYATTRLVAPQANPTMVAPPPMQTRRVEVEEFEETEPTRQGSGAGPWILGALIIAILGVAGYLLTTLNRGGDEPPPAVQQVAVPEVRNLPVGEAETLLTQQEFVPQRGERRANDLPPDTVLDTLPPIGTQVDPGSTIQLILSSGPAPVAVPDVTGDSAADARTALEAAGLTVAGEQQEPSDEVDAGDVIRTDPPAAAQVARGSGVTLVTSSGPSELIVPNVQLRTETEARNELANFCGTPPCLSVVVTATQVSDEIGEDRVIIQDPPPGTAVAPGTTVGLVLSEGPPPPSPTPEPTPTVTATTTATPTVTPSPTASASPRR